MRLHLSLLVLFPPFLFPAFVVAQSAALTAHPQETLQNGNGNLVPFGVTSTGIFAEGRTHMLIPKDELPSFPALLTAIEVHGQSTATLDYASLAIDLAPSTATSLSTSFAANLTTVPTSVLAATSLQVAYSSTSWTTIPFAAPYVHDGTSSLLIEVRKVVQTAASYPFMTMSTSSSPPRTDRPNMVYSLGGPGSGASTSPVANSIGPVLSVRLVWTGIPTIRNRGDLGTSGNQYNVGGSVTMTVNGPAGHLWVLAAALSFLPTAVVVPGLTGDLRLNGPVVFAGGLLDAGGVGSHLIAIPNNPGLVGAYLAYQGAVVDPVTVAITLTNGTDHFINP